MMSFFNPEFPIKEKLISHHPWERKIKDIYGGKIKHAHNSIRNPEYPKKKEKIYSDRVQLMIIGNRTTKEFIYCMKLVKGMYKYKWRSFDVPIIRGVTGIEWPTVWRDLKIQHGGIAYCLKSQVAVLVNGKFLGGDEELREFIQTKYIYHLYPDYYNESVEQFTNYIRSSGRPCAYMHIAIDNEHIGTLIFMLYSELLPYTTENFLRLCITKKGGYGGTPIHRIVKDGWIQCGGFGLKSTDMDCENFIIPQDRRGVLCMANDGRHTDCSTQFFVLLQPAPWMAFKYVAFGQLIEGEETLKKIENVPTWYESPEREIIIYQAGILNMECHDFMINKETKAYIQGHIEDLNVIGDIFYETLLEKVFLELELRCLERMQKELAGEGESEREEIPDKNIHETKRFINKKEDIQKQIQGSQIESRRGTSVSHKLSDKSRISTHRTTSTFGEIEENKDFDVDEYVYEPEESEYKHVSIIATVSVVVKPERPFYIPLTDVPYPGEVDSTYDLKKFLKGDYCLESDLQPSDPRIVFKQKESYPSAIFTFGDEEETVTEEEESLDSEDEKEIKRYLKMNVDNVSFAGEVIKSIAKAHGKINIFENWRKSELITDEELRRLKMASAEYNKNRSFREKKVSISVPDTEDFPREKIKRRQTGFVHPKDLEQIQLIEDEPDEDLENDGSRRVTLRLSPSVMKSQSPRPSTRRPTGFVRGPPPEDESDIDVTRQSVLTRLYDDVAHDDDQPGPTLKDYKPVSFSHPKNFLLTLSPNFRITDEEDTKNRFLRHSITVEDESYEKVLNLQHGKKISRKISSDYVKTIDQIEHKFETSIRSIEFAKTRPTLSVVEYQMKNQRYQDELKKASKSQMLIDKTSSNFGKKQSRYGLRLPGDTPLYCQSLQMDAQSSKSVGTKKSRMKMV